jgi:D-3-phosphoglycerate dehydrogenase
VITLLKTFSIPASESRLRPDRASWKTNKSSAVTYSTVDGEGIMRNQVRVLVCDPINPSGLAKLRNADFRVDVKPTITVDELMKIVSDYHVLIVRSRTKITNDILGAGKQLKIVGRAGAGLDNIDVESAQKLGVKVLNTPEAASEAVAELAIGLFLSLARSIPRADKNMKDKEWTKHDLMGWELRGKTLGTIGLGNIGERVARLAKAIGMKVLITKRTPPDPAVLRELDGEFVPLRKLLRRSDIVTIHVPYTAETRHMISEKEFTDMKKGAYLVNTSRGAIVDEEALLEALRSGKLAGAALDVFEAEPPTDWTLAQLPNVICTPHIGAQTREGQEQASVLLAERIISFFH